MLPSRFEYHRAGSLDEAFSLLAQYGDEAKVLAGGQSLIPMMKLRFASPGHLVDVNHVTGLDGITESDGMLRIGALVRHNALDASDVIKTRYPTIAAAAPLIADPLVRNLGTIGGSLAHADPAGDLGSVMLSLGGSVVLKSSGGERTVPIGDFLVDTFTTSLRPNEMLTEVQVPMPSGNSGGTYLKLERKVGDFATVGVAVQPVDGERPHRPCRHRADGGGAAEHRGHRGRDVAGRGRAERRGVRGGRSAGRRGLEPGHGRPGVRRVQAAHGGGVRAARTRARARDGERGLSGRKPWRSRSRSTERIARPTSRTGCCSST